MRSIIEEKVEVKNKTDCIISEVHKSFLLTIQDNLKNIESSMKKQLQFLESLPENAEIFKLEVRGKEAYSKRAKLLALQAFHNEWRRMLVPFSKALKDCPIAADDIASLKAAADFIAGFRESIRKIFKEGFLGIKE